MKNKIANMNALTTQTLSKINDVDLFISAMNCEQRGTEVLGILSKNKKIKDAILFDYKKLRPSYEDNELVESYKNSAPEGVNIIVCNNDADDVMHLNSQTIDENAIVGIDITNFCVPDLFRIMYVLRKIKNIKTIYAFYTEPKYYLQHYDIWGENRKITCERNYKVLDEYFVSSTPDKTLLVCFLGFEYLISKYVSESANVKDTIVINGFPAYFPKLKDISLANNFELVSTLSKKNIYRSKANDPFSAYNTLRMIKTKFPEYILNICSLGTKPMALGACIFALEHETTVKVSYPLPKIYSKTTAKQASEMWYYII